MSIIKDYGKQKLNGKPATLIEVIFDKGQPNGSKSQWIPTPEEKRVRGIDMERFALGYTTMYTPRVEFSDLSTVDRQNVDTLAWNTYQPNNGDGNLGDSVNGWHSTAVRPIERNKAISIAAHATARLIFPRIFAENDDSDPQEDAAKVLRDLMEWSGEKSNYAWTSLRAVIQALIEPVSIVHTEYCENYNPKDEDGYQSEDDAGFIDTIVPTDSLFIENFFEPDIQKQAWLVWRRVQGHALMEKKYGHLPNFKHVQPGMQTLWNDANACFYSVYDSNMRSYEDEEIIVYSKQEDIMRIYVNGILLTSPDNKNPRKDKLYPFAAFGYEFIRANQCFYYKSLVHKISHDADIVNSLYPMIIDGTYLNMIPPMVVMGNEIISSDVYVPGRVTTLSAPESQLQPIKVATDLRAGMETLMKVEESINQSSEIQPITTQAGITAYQVAQAEQRRNETLGLFIQMIGHFVKQYGRLRMGDILQHLTVADANKITDKPGLVYKSFLMHGKDGKKNKKIKFDADLMENPGSALEESYKTKKMEKENMELYRVNPKAFRELKYTIQITPDILAPKSDEVERLYRLEAYDRAIQNPTLDQQMVTKDFLLDAYSFSSKDPDKYLAQGGQGIPGMGPMPGMPSAPPTASPAPTNPLTALAGVK